MRSERVNKITKKFIDKYSFQILGLARQTVLSYVLSLFLLSIFVIILMLRRRGINAIEVEVILLPLVIDAL
jgi:uncharacterized membrane protein